MINVDDILKSKLSSFDETPPPELLHAIHKRYATRQLRKLCLSSTAVALVVTTAAILLTYNAQPVDTEIVTPVSTHVSNDIHTIKDKTINQQVEAVDDNLDTPYSPCIEMPTDQRCDDNGHVKNASSDVLLLVDFFPVSDTVVCGTEAVFDFAAASPSDLHASAGCQLSTRNALTTVAVTDYGRYNVVYNHNNHVDTLHVTFAQPSKNNVQYQKDNLCENENLILSIDNEATLLWNDNSFTVKQLATGRYEISGFRPGNNVIRFETSNGRCQAPHVKVVHVDSKPSYTVTTTTNYCAKSNATLKVNGDMQSMHAFVLNDNLVSYNGTFDHLPAGIYFLSINYGNGCYLRDTLLISDSLYINPYFVSQRDNAHPERYNFANASQVDDNPIDDYDNVRFAWSVNDRPVSNMPNLDYTFTDVANTVRLDVIVDDNCRSSYSETIFLSESTEFKIPNIFTPNGDGIGDYFTVYFDGMVNNYRIVITGRNGEVVFESNDINAPWDGKIRGNNNASEGTYFYIISGEDRFGNKTVKNGALQLVR